MKCFRYFLLRALNYEAECAFWYEKGFTDGETIGYEKGLRHAQIIPYVTYNPTRDPNRASTPLTPEGQSPPPCS